ncbi:HAD family hydrolase [Halosimplex rubrum]|uniref:HAD family hydrolase n=1 Tax=Halosimplex rubrum TaxID=869889 RepID=A0A7D5NYY9_9EURY|nr:HAD hydrolase-like protein [Halosimplex rubrum]QLH76826.1 HAD family hydrolase [Halosimplex rubrum]
MTLDLVIFDLDGTLVQLDFTGNGMQNVRTNLQSVFAEEGINREFSPLLVDLEDALETVSEVADENTAARIHQEAFQVVAEMECDAVSRQEVYNDAKTVLKRVATSDSTLAVATNNTRGAAEAAMDAAGFPEPDYLITVDDVNKPKPDSAMIDALLKQVDHSPTTLAIVGDRISDAESVRRSCVDTDITTHTVLVDRSGENPEDSEIVDHVVTSLTDALDILPIESSKTK